MTSVMVVLTYFISLFLIIVNINKYMHIFQQSFYEIDEFLPAIKTTKSCKMQIYEVVLIALAILSFFYPFILFVYAITCIFIAYKTINNRPVAKKKFVYTNRVKITYCIIAILLLLSIVGVYYLSNLKYISVIYVTLSLYKLVSIVIMLIGNIIAQPLLKLFNLRYINEAKRIIKSNNKMKIIGITGSYGKTSTKNIVSALLEEKYITVMTPKSYNTTLGVVKTIREQIKPYTEVFICEMGAARLGEIQEICEIAKPDISVITSIGPQHLESFKTIENIIKTKFELYDSVNKNGGITFLNYDNEYLAKQNKSNTLAYGINNEKLDYNAYNLKSSSQGLSFSINNVDFKTKLIGRHNIVNITGAIAVANYLEIPLDRLVPRVREFKSVEHRLQLISKGNLNIIDDAYNSNPVSSKSAIDTLSEFDGTKIIVTPGLIELGGDEEKYNFEFGEYMCDVCDYIFLVNSTISKYVLNGINSKKYNNDKIFMVNSPQEAVMQITNFGLNDKITVLLENDLPDNYNL